MANGKVITRRRKAKGAGRKGDEPQSAERMAKGAGRTKAVRAGGRESGSGSDPLRLCSTSLRSVSQSRLATCGLTALSIGARASGDDTSELRAKERTIIENCKMQNANGKYQIENGEGRRAHKGRESGRP